MNRGWKIFVRITMVFALLFVGLYGSEDTFAWIGTGEGGSSSSSPTGPSLGSCDDYNLWMYAVDCAGVSWIYYEAQSETNNDTVFPALESEPTNVSNVSIPGECSKRGGGFWHFGINSFGVYVDGDGLYTGGYYGHWTTMNSGHYVATWAPYKTANLNGKQLQSFGVYKMEKYGAYQDALKAYQQAYLYENPGATAPTEIPGRVWGFCWNPDMENTGFKGTSRVLAENRGWDEVADNKKKQLSGADSKVEWYPKSGKENGGPETLVVEDCNIESGCEVYFRHYLKRDGGEDFTRYWIKRTRNGVQEYEKNDTDDGKHDNNLLAWDSVTIKPGEKVCETLEFYSDGSKANSKASSTICAAAVATVGSNIDAQIRDKKSSEKYNEYGKSDIIYTRPGDEVEIEGAFEPLYQPMYNISLSNGKTIERTFNDNNDPDWKNAFNIKIGDNCGSRFTSGVGSASRYGGTHKYLVQDGDVGQVKKAWAITNCEESTKNTPREVSLKYSDASGFTATVNTEPISDSVEMRVPYNFKNSVAISSNNGEVVYAGEEVDIEYELRVGGKYNSETSSSADDIYATKVQGAQWGLEVKYDDGEYVGLVSGGGDLDSNGKSLSQVVNVEDKPAGTQFCVRARLWPVNSGSDDNTNKNAFGDEIAEATKCFTIAKKPSFQVWGGDIYAGGADTPIALKKIGSDERAFGSWGELGVFTSGSNSIQSLASGAGFGYQGIFDGRPGGYKLDTGASYSFCDVSTLTFPKEACNNVINNNSGVVSVASLVGAIKEKVSEDSSEIDSEFGLDLEEGAFYAWNSGVGGGLYESTGNITITKDITRDNVSYGLLESVPKNVIHGEYINISCDVSRIDAILIADKDINTCPNVPGKDAHKRSANAIVLRINGAVVAGGTIYFNRTYGAGPGANSMVPAEIINYDSTWYAWNEGTTTTTPAADGSTTIVTSNLMVPVYTRELAPRY